MIIKITHHLKALHQEYETSRFPMHHTCWKGFLHANEDLQILFHAPHKVRFPWYDLTNGFIPNAQSINLLRFPSWISGPFPPWVPSSLFFFRESPMCSFASPSFSGHFSLSSLSLLSEPLSSVGHPSSVRWVWQVVFAVALTP